MLSKYQQLLYKKRFFNCSSEPKYEMQISNTLQLIFRFKQYKSQCLFKHLKKKSRTKKTIKVHEV